MKNIGIITSQIDNYGSLLQAYALQQCLLELNYKSEIISINGEQFKFKNKKLKFLINRIKLALFFLCYPNYIVPYLEIRKRKKKIDVDLNYKNICNDFRNNYLTITYIDNKKLYSSEFINNYDFFIVGSDQIWRGANFSTSKNAFLHFAPKDKRIAYAPSFGGKIEKYNKRFYKKMIKGIKYLSIREILGAQEIKKLTQLDAVITLDPALLVTQEFWRQRMILPDVNEDYILCYFLNSPSELAIKHILYLKNKYNYKIISVFSNPVLQEKFNADLFKPTPFEFLGFFANANIIVTDSFHGCLFSIAFSKSFFVYRRQYMFIYDESSRIDSILTLLNLNNRFIDTDNFIDNLDYIDYMKTNILLEKRRKISREFLENSIDSIKGDTPPQ